MKNNWQLKLHDDVEDPYYELTNGQTTLCADCGFVGETDEGEAAIFKKVADTLNESGIEWHSENKLELDQHIEIMQLQEKLRRLEQWKREASELLAPILDYAQGHKEAQLGGSCTEFVLTRAKQYDDLKVENDGYKQMHTDHNKLVREIDVIINGDDAAEQASLCDLVGQIENLDLECAPIIAKYEELEKEHAALKDRVRKMAEALQEAKGFLEWVHSNMVVTEDYQTVDFANLYMNTMHVTDEALSEWNEWKEQE